MAAPRVGALPRLSRHHTGSVSSTGPKAKNFVNRAAQRSLTLKFFDSRFAKTPLRHYLFFVSCGELMTMGYRNKTYVVFDGDEDMWAYAYMLGWKQNEHIDFNFHDAHDINGIRDGSSEETVKRRLKERLANTKQAIVLIGEKTKNLYRYVRWEIETCISLGIPVLGVNLNGSRYIDDRCPPVLRGKDAMFVPFKAKIIKYAMDEYFEKYNGYYKGHSDDWHYPQKVYDGLSL
ncbi:MAG: hypothetical protein EOR72_28730 [Mesorhizobium sp.]|nr:MAG: hypothetical protein EOR40_27265 [Mesorhizobium sp.]RWM08161.1 MAG: hypothetical protein EOR72_28730 [Mesorhizobium sp.]TIP06253.1 MAG: hypothetical protein E5X72_02830 [Mesorhizobium sp.]TIP20169.1 MAG: hypothetical protein E5X66_06110 [Mesorhizobium sp.]TJV84456.1 MAG: hypothetical protein E5X45_09225 [Mesorhizobium sp.]